MRNENICRNFCEKSGECLLDKIDQKMDLGVDEEELIDSVKVALPSKAKAFEAVLTESQKLIWEDLEQGELISDEDFSYNDIDEEFIWSDNVECSQAAKGIGPYVVYTLIDVTGPHTYFSECK